MKALFVAACVAMLAVAPTAASEIQKAGEDTAREMAVALFEPAPQHGFKAIGNASNTNPTQVLLGSRRSFQRRGRVASSMSAVPYVNGPFMSAYGDPMKPPFVAEPTFVATTATGSRS